MAEKSGHPGQEKRLYSLLGLAMKAGRIASGEFGVERAIKDGKAHLVIVAADASDNTKKLFHDKCSYYGVPIRVVSGKEALGHAIGKGERASLACTDLRLAEKLLQNIEPEV